VTKGRGKGRVEVLEMHGLWEKKKKKGTGGGREIRERKGRERRENEK